MEQSDNDKSVAPGMEMVITAGELYEVEDMSGQNLNLKGIESPWVMDFLRAYDAFRSVRRTLGADHQQSLVAFAAVEDEWAMMPMRLVQDMPSYRAGGIIVPGG